MVWPNASTVRLRSLVIWAAETETPAAYHELNHLFQLAADEELRCPGLPFIVRVFEHSKHTFITGGKVNDGLAGSVRFAAGNLVFDKTGLGGHNSGLSSMVEYSEVWRGLHSAGSRPLAAGKCVGQRIDFMQIGLRCFQPFMVRPHGVGSTCNQVARQPYEWNAGTISKRTTRSFCISPVGREGAS